MTDTSHHTCYIRNPTSDAIRVPSTKWGVAIGLLLRKSPSPRVEVDGRHAIDESSDDVAAPDLAVGGKRTYGSLPNRKELSQPFLFSKNNS